MNNNIVARFAHRSLAMGVYSYTKIKQFHAVTVVQSEWSIVWALCSASPVSYCAGFAWDWDHHHAPALAGLNRSAEVMSLGMQTAAASNITAKESLYHSVCLRRVTRRA